MFQSAVTVEVTGGKTEPFQITFSEYRKGDAPVLVENLCSDLFLKIQQQGQGQVTLLSPYHSLLYTWDDPTRPRKLIWNVYNNKGSGFHVDLLKDGYSEEKINIHSVTNAKAESSSSEDSDSSDSTKTTLNKKIRRDKLIIYWVCYRNGYQKTLLFTQDHRIYSELVKQNFKEFCDLECLFSFAGLGLSVFSPGEMKKEHVYASVNDVPATWEVNVGHKWKTLTLELASWIEDKYRLHYKKCQLKDYIHIDFEKMFMLKPFFAELKRSYSPAVYLQYRRSPSSQFLSFKVQSLQVDNNQASGSDSTIFCSIPVDSIKVTKPFFCVNVFKNNEKNCDVYKDVQLEVGDFYARIDNYLLVKLAEMFAESRKRNVEVGALYREDMNSIHVPITKLLKQKNKKVQTLIENLELSPVGIQLCISRKNHAQILSDSNCPVSNFLEYFFPANLSAYMPYEGVRHK